MHATIERGMHTGEHEREGVVVIAHIGLRTYIGI